MDDELIKEQQRETIRRAHLFEAMGEGWDIIKSSLEEQIANRTAALLVEQEHVAVIRHQEFIRAFKAIIFEVESTIEEARELERPERSNSAS